MSRLAACGKSILLVIVWLALASGCARLPPDTGKTPLAPRSFSDLQQYLLGHTPDLDQFRLRGPFDVKVDDDYEIRLSTSELIKTDLFLSAHTEKAPLVIFLHGHGNTKDAHTFQAMHVASWGMHALAVQLPEAGPWIDNGKVLAKIARFIYRWPEIIDSRVDVNKIILVGHSFGGAAVAVALADGAPAAGGILLDPAAVGADYPKYIRRIDKPVLLLGADEYLSQTNNRDYFFRFIRSGISEISIKDATHEDAQYPAEYGYGTEELQVTFVSAITAAALSLAATGNFDYAWSSYNNGSGRSRFFNAKRK